MNFSHTVLGLDPRSTCVKPILPDENHLPIAADLANFKTFLANHKTALPVEKTSMEVI